MQLNNLITEQVYIFQDENQTSFYLEDFKLHLTYDTIYPKKKP